MITTQNERFLAQKDVPASLLKNRRTDAYESAIIKIENIIDTADMYNIKECAEDCNDLKKLIKKHTKYSQYSLNGGAKSGRFLNVGVEEVDTFIRDSAMLLENVLDCILRHELDIISRDLKSTLIYNEKISIAETAEKSEKKKKVVV